MDTVTKKEPYLINKVKSLQPLQIDHTLSTMFLEYGQFGEAVREYGYIIEGEGKNNLLS